jgi:hypothetical protein
MTPMDQGSTSKLCAFAVSNNTSGATDGGSGRGGWWRDWSKTRLKEISVHYVHLSRQRKIMNPSRDLLVGAPRSKLKVKTRTPTLHGVFIIISPLSESLLRLKVSLAQADPFQARTLVNLVI